jgi:precorrin-2/cobalt-factor-2 C20-methyltransferase
VGPGDPELITVKGARLLASAKHVFVPKARIKEDSLALDIASRYIGFADVHELLFPMVTEKAELALRWNEAAQAVAEILVKGEDACFLTLGDPLLYSTYIYLIRALSKALPEARIHTVPGVTAFSAVAALTNQPVGEAKEPVTIIPASDDLDSIRQAVKGEGTVVLMKVGKRLNGILDILEEAGVIDNGVFAAYAGQPGERIETNLRSLRDSNQDIGYLSTIIVHTGKKK